MAAGKVDNDTRGWILCIASGVACSLGATIICVDVLVRQFPGQKHFRIEDSNAFLACSLSLSFGVMLFSALYSMLPSAMRYLSKGGWDRQSAGFFMMACFVAGFVGIQVISRVLHQYMPSHIVDCDHTHKEHTEESRFGSGHRHSRTRGRRQSVRTLSSRSTIRYPHMTEVSGLATESTPLLPGETQVNGHTDAHRHSAIRSETLPHIHGIRPGDLPQSRRSSLKEFRNFVRSFVKDKPHKPHCDESATCYGFSEPCGQECDKLKTSLALSRSTTLLRSNSLAQPLSPTADVPEGRADNDTSSLGISPHHGCHTHGREHTACSCGTEPHSHPPVVDGEESEGDCDQMEEDLEAQHHHHVPENAFLSIGLQTVIAITLHKFPEGFITYATNHANPSLGFNVFMALFVHNIAEGFSMALPLYLALGSRFKAIAWSSLLGGLSQPVGAGVAVLWFKLANRSDFAIDNTAYACLFAVTAGIMTSVALQLFVESLSLNHNRNLSILFAFLGMTMLGFSNALVTE
ncbi:Zinc/iron permease [Podospora aff. communis PSN243]|uniref:Zinc/iron permease n=1 Tax=Podospora aff. communis PSN243 TaxID=3040156 RepID=A0AAV9H6G7_9PEZI|nr:Zinc/iron permease [Podospora aff. communis PSN243]